MIRSENPRINVDEIRRMALEQIGRVPNPGERLARLAATVHVRSIEAQLAHAEERSFPRAVWPEDLRGFPFNVRPFQRMALRAMNLATRDQQEVNAALIRAVRESLALCEGLADRVAALEAQIERERSAEWSKRILQRRSGDGE